MGFSNIEFKRKQELIKGWLHKPNYDKNIRIDSDKHFLSDKKYKSNAKVCIEYYDFID